MVSFKIDKDSRIAYYTQIVNQFEEGVKSGAIREGEVLPSMNDLAASLDVSRETVKKAYGILSDLSLVAPRQGKGFFVRSIADQKYLRVLIISDYHSVYKQILLSAFQETMSERGDCDTTVLLHNQDVNLLKYYLDRNLDNFDWYVVVPHFSLDADVQKEVVRQLGRIPNRKLILLDRWVKELPGNYGAVYQDFSSDAAAALEQYVDDLKDKKRLRVMALKSSMYKGQIEKNLKDFASSHGLEIVFGEGIPKKILSGDVCILLSSQHDNGLVALARKIEASGLEVGRDVFIICYNDIPLNELVLGGLTTLSTDFALMGHTAAEMILSGNLKKVHNPFRLVRRKTF